MNVWFAKVALLVGIAAMIAIRAPHGHRSAAVKVVESKRGRLEIFLLALMWFGSLIFPLLWIATPLLSFADYPLHLVPLTAGAMVFSLGLWLLYCSHADLSTNWSISLELRENHALVTTGVYRSIRHPMYAAIFLQAIGQALFVPNWIAGPFEFFAFLLMFALRVGPEERMMLARFGTDYENYMRRSKRLIPGIW
jgi:protein-S-isoprenylcysteine O-methyltransferase Ste14